MYSHTTFLLQRKLDRLDSKKNSKTGREKYKNWKTEMHGNINWFILLLVKFKCSTSPNVETTSVGLRKRGEGVNRLWLLPVYVTIQRER